MQDATWPLDPMLIHDVDFDYASSMAGQALQLMSRHNVPATPQNFEVWFTFVRGAAPDLNKTINILLANRRSLDAETNQSLYFNYIEGHSDGAKHTHISTQLQKVLLDAQQFLAAALTDNRSQVEALGNVASQIEENSDPRSIIKALVAELAKAVQRTSEVEAHFSASLQELEAIRDKLTISERRSKIDPLTGLANRLRLDEFVRRAQIAAMETGEPLSILLIDMITSNSSTTSSGINLAIRCSASYPRS